MKFATTGVPTKLIPPKISGRLLTRNWSLNLVGWGIPLTVALVATPCVVRGLGVEQFGILSIASALLGYFSIFDLGFGRATTKFVAEALAQGELERLPKFVSTSFWSLFAFGVLGTLASMGLIPVLVRSFLKISPALVPETTTSLLALSSALCVVLTGNGLRGVLEAAQLFETVNYIKVPTNTAMFLLPAIGVFFHLSLPEIVWLLVGARIIATIAYLAACLSIFPTLRVSIWPDRHCFRPLLRYGGWLTVSSVITPLLTYTDRLIIGSLISMNAVGFYSAPYEALNRAWVVPDTLVATLFPAFTNLDACGSKRRLEELCARSLKSLLLISVPALLVLALFAQQLLRWWLGAEFATQSTVVLQIMALGMLMHSVALVPSNLLQGVGRPDLTGAFSLLEFVFQAGCCWVLVRRFGIAGAAMAWTLRALLDAVLTFGAVFWIDAVSVGNLLRNGMRRTLFAVCALALSFGMVWQTNTLFLTQLPIVLLLVLIFALVSWTHVLDGRDRDLLIDAATHVRFAFARSRQLSVGS